MSDRDMSMTDERLETLERFQYEAGDEHRLHHEWISAWITKEKKREERWEKIKTHVGGWLIVSVLGAIGTGAWHGFQYLREHLK